MSSKGFLGKVLGSKPADESEEYTEIDFGVLYRVLQEGLSDFEMFGRYIEDYLEAEAS